MSDHEMAGEMTSARTLALAALKEMSIGVTVDQGVQFVIAEALVAIALALTEPQTGKG